MYVKYYPYPTIRTGNFITRLLPVHLLPGPGIVRLRFYLILQNVLPDFMHPKGGGEQNQSRKIPTALPRMRDDQHRNNIVNINKTINKWMTIPKIGTWKPSLVAAKKHLIFKYHCSIDTLNLQMTFHYYFLLLEQGILKIEKVRLHFSEDTTHFH